MSPNSQTQRAGTGSNQVQVSGDFFSVSVVGVSEDRAREIADQQARLVIDQYAEEGHIVIAERLGKLDDKIVPDLAKQGRLDAFADPAFQRTYRKAQNGAAATEREADYDMLAALLVQRATTPRDRATTVGIERAIEVVDLIDDEALRAITVLSAVTRWSPTSPRIHDGLDHLDSLHAQFLDGPLPTGADWLEHVDLLDVARINYLMELRKFDDFFPDRLPGYTCTGVASSDAPEFVGGAYPQLRWANVIVDHELKPGFKRLGAPTGAMFVKRSNLTAEVSETVVAQAGITLGFDVQDIEVRSLLVKEVRMRRSLALVAEWWDQIPNQPLLTAVGRSLALANMYRLDANGQLPADSNPVTGSPAGPDS